MHDHAPTIIRLQQTGSTNSDAMRLALAGEPLPLWVVADRQTAGRGRSGRAWVSAPGNLFASYAFGCRAPLGVAAELSLVAGVALIDAIRTIHPSAPVRLKWPNDVLIDGAKVAGILVETTTQVGHPGFVAILGFGVNIVDAPSELGSAATTLAVSLSPWGEGRGEGVGSRDALLAALVHHVELRIGEWSEGRGFDAIRQAWLDRAGAIGEAITINANGGRLTGRYRGLASSGALMAEIDGVLREISYGDVALQAALEAEAL